MRRTIVLLLSSLMFVAMAAHADAPLAKKLDLSVEQSSVVKQIQADHRKEFAAARGDYNRESRALRRARIDNDAEQIAELERSTEVLKAQMASIRSHEDAQIRELLSETQRVAFNRYIEEREAMVGSSRDARAMH